MINIENKNITINNDSYKYISCPICNKFLSRSKNGVQSHLRIHIKEGTISNEDKVTICVSLFRRGMNQNRNDIVINGLLMNNKIN